MINLNRLRVLGNALTVLGYFVILHVDSLTGSVIKIIGFSLVLPSVLKYKLYDIVALAAMFIAIDLSNVIRILLK